MDENDPKWQLALCRFQVIAPLLTPESTTLKQRLAQQAEKNWLWPDGSTQKFTEYAIEKWLYRYRRQGLAGLLDSPRKDAGSFRAISDAITQAIHQLLDQHPTLKSNILIDELQRRRLITDNRPSTATLYRYLKTVPRPQLADAEPDERRAFEAEYANALWQVDLKYGPDVPQKQNSGAYKKCPTYLIAILDDHSRLLCHGQFSFTQDLPVYVALLKTAMAKRGIPKKLYSDNGAIFKAAQIVRIAAILGIYIPHAKSGDAPPRGKIERLFRTVSDRFLEALPLHPVKDLDDLNARFQAWSESDYNHRLHSVTGCTPYKRWTDTAFHVRPLPLDADPIFYFEVCRRVRKDTTFSLDGKFYETAAALAGKTVTVSYDLFDPRNIFVRYDNRDFGRATPLDRNANYHRRRQRHIKPSNDKGERP